MKTSVNGKEAEWTDEIRALWHERAEKPHAECCAGKTVTRANYFTPRPYVDEYNDGSDEYGFVWVVGRNVNVVTWR